MMKEMNRRTFLKAVGVAGAVSAMTALVGCSGGVIVPDGSTSLANLKPLNGYYDWNTPCRKTRLETLIRPVQMQSCSSRAAVHGTTEPMIWARPTAVKSSILLTKSIRS